MATRRTPKSTSDLLGPQHITASNPASDSNIAPAVPTPVIVKLLLFTFAMIVFPISTFYVTKITFFDGNSTWAGASAAVVANVVLIAYVIVAVLEDQGEHASTGKGKEKKSE